MALLTPEFGLLFWMVLSFGIVFFVLAKFGWPIIVNMVDERKAYIDKSLDEARQAHERLIGIQDEQARLLHETREEQQRLLKDANETKTKIISDAKERAEVEASRIREENQLLIQKEKEVAMQDVRSQISILSLDIAEKVLRKNLDNKPAQQDLVNKLIKEIS
ncbi:MAG: F0F1 ATP synthase subunit B [Candidatus Symbiothrix sp.]|jgi:F-type H+-transporting ATPase subunit b|nr:F0F1 ATP synthase subunit B [Candidatus Symbiothrix sp.]